MSIYEPNTADQNPPPPSPVGFVHAARLRAAPWSAIAAASVIWSAWSFYVWTTWPTHVSMRSRHLGMDWWLHISWAAAAAAVICVGGTVVELLLAPRRARRYFAAFQRRMDAATADIARAPDAPEH